MIVGAAVVVVVVWSGAAVVVVVESGASVVVVVVGSGSGVAVVVVGSGSGVAVVSSPEQAMATIASESAAANHLTLFRPCDTVGPLAAGLLA